MCGIVYSHNFLGQSVNDRVFDQYFAQRQRGTEGFGIYDGQELNMVHETKENKIVKWLARYDSNMILLHHRWPTSTINVKKAAHPFSTKKYFGNTEYILVHNGVMRNHNLMYVDHQERGIEYQSLLDDLTFNDSESLLWDFALTMEGHQTEMQSIGRIAFICLKKVDGVLTHMYFGRNSNPLNLTRTKDSIDLSSEGKGDPIDADTLYTWNYELQRLTTKYMEFEEYEPMKVQPHSYNYDYDEDDELASVGEILNDRYGDMYDQEEEDFLLDCEPTPNEVQTEAMSYLARFRGHFEEAYWAIEIDYDEAMNAEDDYNSFKQRILLESVLDYISHDTEYENENSVSSMWSALWT